MGILMIADAMSSKLVSEQTARVQEFHYRVGDFVRRRQVR